MAQIRAGSSAAFEALDARYRAAILQYCRHLLADPDEAEDAVQHTFLAAYTSIVTSDCDLEVRPWLYVIARNRCYSILRSRREVAVGEVDHGTSEEPGALVQRREDLRDLVLDVSRLPEDQRAALIMAEFGARSHDEIAGVLEVPRAKVKALVFQARESLVASRNARDTSCADIRTELRTVRGGGLRRGTLRRHLRECAGCREYRRQLRVQRTRFAAFLPLAPWLGLRTVLARSAVVGRAAPVTGGAGTASAAIKVGALKPLAGALAAMLSAASAVVAVHSMVHSHPVAHPPGVVHHAVANAAVRGRSSQHATLVGHHVVLRVAGTQPVVVRHPTAMRRATASSNQARAAGRSSWIDRRALGRVVASHSAARSRLISRPKHAAATPPARPAPPTQPVTSGPAAPPLAPLPVISVPQIPIELPKVTTPGLIHGPDARQGSSATSDAHGPGDGPVGHGQDGRGDGTGNTQGDGKPTDQPTPPADNPHSVPVPQVPTDVGRTPTPVGSPAVVPAPAAKPTLPAQMVTRGQTVAPAPKPTPTKRTVAPGHTTTPPNRPVASPHRVPVHSGSTA